MPESINNLDNVMGLMENIRALQKGVEEIVKQQDSDMTVLPTSALESLMTVLGQTAKALLSQVEIVETLNDKLN